MANQTKKKTNEATRFQPGNQHRFTAGDESPNPGGKASKYKLLSRAIRERLGARAPDDVCLHYKLPIRSSWAQVHATSISLASLRGDTSASRLLADLSGDSVRHQLDLGLGGFDEETGEPSTPLLEVVFVSSKYKNLEGRKVTDSTATVIENTLELDGHARVGSRPPMLIEAHIEEPKPAPVTEAAPEPAPPAKPKATRFSDFAKPRPAPQPLPRRPRTDTDLHLHDGRIDAAKRWPVPEHIRKEYEESLKKSS